MECMESFGASRGHAESAGGALAAEAWAEAGAVGGALGAAVGAAWEGVGAAWEGVAWGGAA